MFDCRRSALFLRWTCTLSSLVVAAVYGFSLFWWIERDSSSNGDWYGTRRGAVIYIWQNETRHSGITYVGEHTSKDLIKWWPEHWSSVDNRGSKRGYLIVPLWIPLLAISLPTAFLWFRRFRLRAPGRCTGCGYDLTANQSNKCPECGTPTPKSKPAAPISEPEPYGPVPRPATTNPPSP